MPQSFHRFIHSNVYLSYIVLIQPLKFGLAITVFTASFFAPGVTTVKDADKSSLGLWTITIS